MLSIWASRVLASLAAWNSLIKKKEKLRRNILIVPNTELSHASQTWDLMELGMKFIQEKYSKNY